MASACVNNIGVPPESFLDCSPSYASYGWLNPKISFVRDVVDEESKIATGKTPSPIEHQVDLSENRDLEVLGKDVGDFEFRLENPVKMLPADELFFDGKLVPLQLATIRPAVALNASKEMESMKTQTLKSSGKAEVSTTDPYVFSPKAPRCSSRLKELLGLKRLQNSKQDVQKAVSLPSKNPNPKSLKYFLHRNRTKTSYGDSSLNLPLLRDMDTESISISSHLSLSSSSSSGPDHEDLPKLSLDAEKPNPNLISLNRNPPKTRILKTRVACKNPRSFVDNPTARVGRSGRAQDSNCISNSGVSVDSPRMNSSGKIVFQSLERSSSSPSSFNGGSRIKPRGMERSYSANVRITPVLNVPVCSLRGSSKSGSVFRFGQLFSSPQKRDGATRGQISRNRIDRV